MTTLALNTYLRFLREANNLTQQEVGLRMQPERSRKDADRHVRRLEAGQREPKASTLVAWADAVGANWETVKQLLTRRVSSEEFRRIIAVEADRLAQQWAATLPPEQIPAALAFLEQRLRDLDHTYSLNGNASLE